MANELYVLDSGDLRIPLMLILLAFQSDTVIYFELAFVRVRDELVLLAISTHGNELDFKVFAIIFTKVHIDHFGYGNLTSLKLAKVTLLRDLTVGFSNFFTVHLDAKNKRMSIPVGRIELNLFYL